MITGIGRRAAESIIAEIGTDMSVFPTAFHLASWAGLCPGTNITGAKRRSGKTTKGDRWLGEVLVECAWAAACSRGIYLSSLYWRLARRIGKKKAAVAVAHSILVIIWNLLTYELDYFDLGGDYLAKRDAERHRDRLVGQLQSLGLQSLPGARPCGLPLNFLVREIGVAAAASSPAPRFREEELLVRYWQYLLDERALATKTVIAREPTAQLFLAQHPGRELGDLDGGDVSRFVIRQCGRLSQRSAERLVNGLRSFLRFALVEGLIAAPLTGRGAGRDSLERCWSTRGLTRAEVAAVLANCDRRRAIGGRDYAILVLLARLGLRATEVAALRLDDIDWQAGEIVVHARA
jgi:hypothetical protein